MPPLDTRFKGVMLSPFDGPADAKNDPFCVEEVPWLPLRFRDRYRSLASASLSRTRVAIGASDARLFAVGFSEEPGLVDDEPETVLLVAVICGVRC